MKGGNPYHVNVPIVFVSDEDISLYCLGVVKSDDVNLIGQNFMSGYNIVFDREKNVLGWKPSNCNDVSTSSIMPVSPAKNSGVPPATTVKPESRTGNDDNSSISAPAPAQRGNGDNFPISAPTGGSHSPMLHPFTCALIILLISFLATV
ncbi:hypothetical protein Pint_28556 [Pistacia integerrima]|uniref:Uncharacterized protein n=2 Tax=Pistacia integerrima TaxID=434235 RepID=A0ACC0YP21_9ROSI|nr:hypothetical protein Pint_28566 [Pistacia integerrima]KAJ0041520.1 hypothetical protein Pint_28556 [Pistacia integerrima]